MPAPPVTARSVVSRTAPARGRRFEIGLRPRKDREATMELTSCPECGAVAEVTWRFAEESTDGPVEHVRLRCVWRHTFMGPAASLLPAS